MSKAKAKKQRITSGSRHSNKGHENLKGNSFKDKPERINKKGRPPILIHHITAELKEQGYEPVSESQIIDSYQMLLQLDESQVKAIEKDKKKPFFLRLVAKWMQSQRGMEMLDRVMDRSFGKVLQRQQINATIHDTPIPQTTEADRQKLLLEVTSRLEEIDKSAMSKESTK